MCATQLRRDLSSDFPRILQRQIYLYTERITAAWLGLGELISALFNTGNPLLEEDLSLDGLDGGKEVSFSRC